jgi:predicted nuclease of predicted toxin-antitoxin system
MKFLIDAQLPRRLANLFVDAGFEAIHTLDLPEGNRTSDAEINAISIRDQYVVVTKDADFVNSFHLNNQPYKLLLVSTGNIKNSQLESLFRANLTTISTGFKAFDFIEINRDRVIFHS